MKSITLSGEHVWRVSFKNFLFEFSHNYGSWVLGFRFRLGNPESPLLGLYFVYCAGYTRLLVRVFHKLWWFRKGTL